MDLNEFLDNEETTDLVRIDEGQLILAKQMQQMLIAFEIQKKEIEKQEKDIKEKIKNVMQENGITKYESNDKKIMITLGEDGITETIDKERLFLEKPDIFREYVKETPRKGALRITVREGKKDE